MHVSQSCEVTIGRMSLQRTQVLSRPPADAIPTIIVVGGFGHSVLISIVLFQIRSRSKCADRGAGGRKSIYTVRNQCCVAGLRTIKEQS